jgi:rhamnose transport system permease protein
VTQVIHDPSIETRPSLARRLLAVRQLPILFALVVIVVATAAREPSFLSAANVRAMLLAFSLVLVLAMGQSIVVLARGIDVSMGSNMAMAGVAVAVLYQRHAIDSLWAGAALALLLGAIGGAVNGLLVSAANVPPIIATLGTFGLYRSLAFIVSEGHTVNEGELPRSVSTSGPLAGGTVPWLVVVAFVLAALTFVLMRYTRFGRHVYAVGGNPDAARLRGVPVRRVTFVAYVLSGLTAGVAGILYPPRFGSVNPGEIGLSAELAAIAAVSVGGVSIFGGTGSVAGVVLGALLLGTIEASLSVLHVQSAWQVTAYGAAILLAMALDVAVGRVRRE